jgi:rRNA maturation endonuclease Nob1
MYLLFLSYFKETEVFLTDFRKILISDFLKICPVGVKLFHVDGQTDMMNLMLGLLAILRNHLQSKIQEPILIYITVCLNCSLLIVKVLFCQACGISVGIQHCP